jgi:hypothetical protein
MDPYDAVKEFYLNHLRQGIPMFMIDEMDIGFYFELLDYESERKERTERGYIDQVIF